MKEILLRNVKIEQDENSEEIEMFLTETLGVSHKWLLEAKAADALKWSDHREAVKYLIQAECYDAAHKVCSGTNSHRGAKIRFLTCHFQAIRSSPFFLNKI